MISIKPIHVVIVISVIEKYIPLKMVTIRSNVKPWMNSKVRLAIRGGTACSDFITIRQSRVTWESYQAQRNILTSLIRFAKKKAIVFKSE